MTILDLRNTYRKESLTNAEYNRALWESHRNLFDYCEFLKGSNIKAIEVNEDGVLLRVREPEMALWCPPGDERNVAMTLLNFGSYEPEEMQTALKSAKDASVIFDVGANTGVYSIALAKSRPSAEVYAFEPVSQTFDGLVKNLKVNGVSNVKPVSYGLLDQGSVADFYVDPAVLGASSAAPLGDQFGDVHTERCKVTTLDQFAESLSVAPGFIKCDVEGAELLVFRGAAKILAERHPVIMTEMHRKWSKRFNYHPNDLIAISPGLVTSASSCAAN